MTLVTAVAAHGNDGSRGRESKTLWGRFNRFVFSMYLDLEHSFPIPPILPNLDWFFCSTASL